MKVEALSCPTCGGRLTIAPNSTKVTCQYCGNEHVVHWGGDGVSLQQGLAWICPQCGTAHPTGTLYCSQCAQKLHVECPECHKISELSAVYCSHCGANIQQSVRRKNREQAEKTISQTQSAIADCERGIKYHENRIRSLTRYKRSFGYFGFRNCEILNAEVEKGCVQWGIFGIMLVILIAASVAVVNSADDLGFTACFLVGGLMMVWGMVLGMATAMSYTPQINTLIRQSKDEIVRLQRECEVYEQRLQELQESLR